MKKFLNWIKSPKSDFALFVIVLILANIASQNAFLRFDLTEPKSYSLSKASKQMVKTLEEPLSVRVFFDDNLPSPYNSVAQYVKDILVEYKGAANKNLTITYMDMKKPENANLASEYGLHQIQIQEVKNNEVGFKQGYMGLVISYGDSIELLDAITSADGFEYKFTSAVSKMMNTANTLATLKEEKINLTLYMTSSIPTLGISGADQVKQLVEKAYKNVNKQNFDSLEYNVVSPTDEEAKTLVEKYGIQTLQYKARGNGAASNTAAFGLVLEYKDNFRVIPLSIQRSIFGYGIAGLDSLEEDLNESLTSLLSKTTEVGYIVGHNELDLGNEKYSGNFDKLVSLGSYTLVELDLSEDSIPANMNTIIINGPQFDFTEEELYKVDQFIMKGGNVMFFVDSMNQDGTANYYGGQKYVANELNLDRLLNQYGVKREFNYVMDKNCYTQNSNQYGKMSMYWVPILQKGQMPKRHPITANLGYVIMLQNGVIDYADAKNNKDVNVTVLARSSNESWTESENISLNPMMMSEPDASQMGSKDLAVLLEGKFKSAFDKAPDPVAKEEYDDDGNLIEQPVIDTSNDEFETANHIASSILPGKVFVIGTSYITTYQILDGTDRTPIGMFLLNLVDYMNGNEDRCTMRTKGLLVNTLTIKSKSFATFCQYFNEFGIAALVAIAGLIIWRLRVKRRRSIRMKYNPEDSREVSNIQDENKTE